MGIGSLGGVSVHGHIITKTGDSIHGDNLTRRGDSVHGDSSL